MKKIFEKFVDAPLNFIDNGKFFRKGIHYYLILIAAGIILGGIYFILSGLFKDYGYLNRMEHAQTGIKVRSYIASVFTFLISLAGVISIGLIFFKRSNDLQNREYNGLLQYLYKDFFPTLIKIYGESLAIIPIIISLITFLSALLVAIPYNPINELAIMMYRTVNLNFISDALLTVNADGINNFGDYMEALLISGIGGIIVAILISFSMFMITYIAIEVYSYFIKIIINLVNFIPKFALPIWVQRSDRYNKKPTIDINDL